jgi:uncharacterized protein
VSHNRRQPTGPMPLERVREAPAGRAPRHVCVVLHDVAPSRWAGCTLVLGQLRAIAAQAGVELPVTLLVVPKMHGAAGTSPHYMRWLHHLVKAGNEVALHGFTHLDDGPAPRGLAERFMRRTYTAGEGEFAAIGREQADARLASASAWAAAHHLPVAGFVAPAWLLSEAGWDAVSAAGFPYTCTLNRIVTLPERHALAAPSVVFSTRSAPRRVLSIAWNRLLGWQQRWRGARVMRLELHPTDADDPHVLRCWSRLLAEALRDRQPLRLSEAAALARHEVSPPARRSA